MANGLLRPSTNPDDYPVTVRGTNDWMRNSTFDLRRKRRDIELNRYRRDQRRLREQNENRVIDQVAAESGVATPTNASNAVVVQAERENPQPFEVPALGNVYQAADQSVSRNLLTPEQQAELDADRERYGSILDGLAYLNGNTSRRASLEKRVGSTQASRADRSKERQDYIDQVVGGLIMKYQPANSGQMKTLLESAGITDVDDIKRAFEVYEYFKPEVDDGSAAVLSLLAENTGFNERRPVMSEIIQQTVAEGGDIDFDKFEALNQLIGKPETENAEISKTRDIAGSMWERMPDEDKQVILDTGISKDQWISRKQADMLYEHYQKPLVATQTDEDLLAHYKDSTKQLMGVLWDDDTKYAQARAVTSQATEALRLLDDGLVKTGPLSKPQLVIQRFINSLIDKDKAGSDIMSRLKIGFTEYWEQITNMQGAQFLQLTKGPITEKEHDFFVGMGPQLNKTEAGNRLLLKGVLRRNARDVLIHDLTVDYVAKNGGINQETMRGYLSYLFTHPEMIDYLQNDSTITDEMMEEARAEVARIQGNAGIPTEGGYSLHESGEKIDLNTPEMAQYKDLADSTTPFTWNGKKWVKKGGFLIRVQD